MSEPAIIRLIQYVILVVLVTSVELPVQITCTDTDKPADLKLIPDVCPSLQETSYNLSLSLFGTNDEDRTTCVGKDEKSDGLECTLDDQCKIGSKCCSVDQCGNRRCVDLKDGSVSGLKVQQLFVSRTQRRRRQSFGCVACACIRNCRTHGQCIRRYGKVRRYCYHNSCSSYCIA